MAVPGTGHDEVGVRDCGERGDVAGLRGTWGVLVGSCFGGGFGGCGRGGEAVGMVDGVDGLLLVHRPEADVSVCAAVSSGLMMEGGIGTTHPLSLPVTKYSSSIMAMASMLPSSYRSTPFLSFLVFRDSPPVPPPPRKTSCVSSTIFHNRAVRSRAPIVIQRSAFSAAMPTTSSWCPNSVSTYASSSRLHNFTVRSLEHEYS